MNAYLQALMDKPSQDEGCCAVCGSYDWSSLHHVVPRSQGGKDGPTIRLCGSGTTGCHGDAENKCLHFRYVDGSYYTGWEYMRTTKGVKYEVALAMDGWRMVKAAR